VAVYRDPVTREILRCWHNPLNGKDVPVVHEANDPVDRVLAASTWTPVTALEQTGRVLLGVDTLLAVPSPLPPPVYAEYSAGNVLQSAELFTYATNRLELDATFLDSASAEVSWTRLGGWLPWMKMGDTPEGNLLYDLRGFKVRGFSALPDDREAFVRANHPGFEHAPTAFAVPNANAWTRFRDLVASGAYDPDCP
jgi:hypothetical protein